MKTLAPDEYYASLPKKRMAALTVYPCPNNTILIVEPLYRKEWLLPGGVVELDESPLAAAKRESMEEIGFEKVTDQLLVVNYIKKYEYKSEAIHFIFKGEALSEEDIASIQLQTGELKNIACATLEEAQKLTSNALSEMLPHAFTSLSSGRTCFMEGSTTT